MMIELGLWRYRLSAALAALLPFAFCVGCGGANPATPVQSRHEPTAPQVNEAQGSCSTDRVAQSSLELRPSPPDVPGSSDTGDYPAPPEPPGVSGTLEVSPDARVVRLHYPLDSDPYGDCKAHAWVERQLAACSEPLGAALRALLEGPTANETKTHSLVDSMRGRGAPLVDSFLGVRLTPSGVAVLEFSGPAMSYLNQAACAQESVKSALRRTATQFEGVLDIAFVVDGKLVTEWDA